MYSKINICDAHTAPYLSLGFGNYITFQMNVCQPAAKLIDYHYFMPIFIERFPNQYTFTQCARKNILAKFSYSKF